MKRPLASVFWLAVKLVSGFLASTPAPCITAPDWSKTVPWITPVVICVWAKPAAANARTTRHNPAARAAFMTCLPVNAQHSLLQTWEWRSCGCPCRSRGGLGKIDFRLKIAGDYRQLYESCKREVADGYNRRRSGIAQMSTDCPAFGRGAKNLAAPTVTAAAAYAIAKCSGSREGSLQGSTNVPCAAGEWITPNSDSTAPPSRKNAPRR